MRSKIIKSNGGYSVSVIACGHALDLWVQPVIAYSFFFDENNEVIGAKSILHDGAESGNDLYFIDKSNSVFRTDGGMIIAECESLTDAMQKLCIYISVVDDEVPSEFMVEAKTIGFDFCTTQFRVDIQKHKE